MNKKSIFCLILVILVAVLLRVWNLDKPEGMWNDEYLTWKIASAKFPFDFFEAIKTNCHAPLYYLYLKGWMFFFKDSDKYLRFSSVIPGVLGVIMMYSLALEYRKKDATDVALTALIVSAISSFLIYFSQEIRIYSLLFFLTALVLFFAFKIFENPTKKNFFLYSICSLLLILTHTIGFVFIFFSTAALLVFAVPKKKAKDFVLFSILGVIVLALPLIPFVAKILMNRGGYFNQWWAPFDFSRILFFFTDSFSPVLTDTAHVYNKFADAFYKNGVVNLGYLIFAVIPTIIGLICFIRGMINPDGRQGYLISVFFCTFLTVLLAAIAGKIVFVTKYMTEIIPVLILIMAYGFTLLKSKAFKTILATMFIVINLFYITVSNTSAIRILRKEGQRLPVVAMQDMGLKKNDHIMFVYYPKEWFYKYVDFSNEDNEPYLNALNITKHNFPGYLKYKMVPSDTFKKDTKEKLRPAFAMRKNPVLEDILNRAIFSGIHSGDKLFLVDLTSVSFFPMSVVNQTAQSDAAYSSAPLLYLAMSYVKEFTVEKAKRELIYDGYYNTGAWRIYVFKKA